ncbi:MAG: AAA family ATPase [Solirubrobacteraceae bacterium]
MRTNPFDHQRPVPRPLLIDRLGELDSLQRAAADTVAIRLAAPRRFGKTSLLNAHVAAMRDAGHRSVRVDLSQVATIADAAGRVARAYASLPAGHERVVDRLLARLGVSIGVGGLSLQVAGSTSHPRADHARDVLAELLDVPRLLHEADGGLTVVCLDEFQDLLTADDKLDGLVRSVVQHHAAGVAYVYAGSAPSLMRALFADRERPLFGQARPLELPPLPSEDSVADVLDMSAAHGVSLDPHAVGRIIDLGAGHPQRTMLLASHLFELTDREDAATDLAALSLDRALAETRDVHQGVWDSLRRAQRAVLTALADGDPPTSQRTAVEHRIARASLQRALERLAADEVHILKRDGRPTLADPLLGEWLRRR